MLKKLLATLGTLALVAGSVALVAGPASAHSPNVTASCAAGVSVNLTDYNTDQPNANHITVTIDGTVTTSQSFGGTFSQAYSWAAAAASHSYEVIVSAYDDPNGYQGWSIDKTGKVDNCSTAVSAAAVTHTDAVCTGTGVVGGGAYTVPPNGTGVNEYQILAGGTWTKINPGTYPTTPGTTVTIRAIAVYGYTLAGTTQWSFMISSPYPSDCVVPVPPTASSSVCDGTPGGSSQASYTIPPVANGYSFTLANSTAVLKPGTVKVDTFPSTVQIVLVLQPGLIVPAGTPTSWTFAFTSPGDCPMTVTPTAPTPQYTSCQAAPGQSSDNGYTIPATAGVTYQLKTGASWTDLAPGFHNLGTIASSVEIQAVPQAHYVLSGTTGWTFTFTAAKDCLVTVVPAASSTQARCDTDHPGQQIAGTYTLASVTGVIYSVKINNGGFVVTAAGTYSAQPGDTVTVDATGDTANGYRVDGAPTWTFTFASAGTCLTGVPVGDPVFVDGTCDVTRPTTPIFGTYEVLVADHVHYEVKVNAAAYIPLAAGVPTQANPGDVVTIKPIADGGYSITPAIANEKLTHTFAALPAPCGDLITHPLVDPSAVRVQMGCFSSGSYTLSNDLSDPAALTWTVNGSTVSEGTYHVSQAGVVTVHVVANGPTYGLEAGATTDWTFQFGRPTSCDLTTLALTGSTPVGWTIFGYALLVSGLALVALRFLRRRDERA